MLIGILADTHNKIERTQRAVDLLCDSGADMLVHCGDLSGPEIVRICSVLPFRFVFGNHDCDMARELEVTAAEVGAVCLGWGGAFMAGEKRIAVVHGHLTMDLQPLLDDDPDYLLSGHSHPKHDFRAGKTRRINPGALHRAKEFSVATIDLISDFLKVIPVDP